ncbi:MAG: uroporphyrinogen-III C-methyltransferase [Austwickia sp.]|nr:uroporphyrinogen-III C-methyltransferase [Actinomycetota bacterium]MCO5310470.1 uroporphyrinogen-III C-methyltransferase [Austwickia sp.]
MLLDLTLTGARVALVGDATATGRAVLRYRAAGAQVHRLTTPAQAMAYAQAATGADVSSGAGAGAVGAAQLIVDVTGGAPEWATAIRALSALAPTTREELATQRAGSITLVGAGPGDPGLHTVAAREALAAADVVLVDRLADHDRRADLQALAAAAQLIDVGKTPGHHRMPQHEIERLMVEHARAGAHVVRLKGGDPFVFGRGGEEVAAAAAAAVPVRVIPGITSAIAAPAAAGIPVTHRETSRAVTIISGHDPLDAGTAERLAGLDGTIVLLMGMATLPSTVANLTRAGMPGDTPAAVVQEGCTPRQRQLVTTLDRLVPQVHDLGLANPSVVVIGAVAALAHGATTPTRPRRSATTTPAPAPSRDPETTRTTDTLEIAR